MSIQCMKIGHDFLPQLGSIFNMKKARTQSYKNSGNRIRQIREKWAFFDYKAYIYLICVIHISV